jgi:hypothetical protein
VSKHRSDTRIQATVQTVEGAISLHLVHEAFWHYGCDINSYNVMNHRTACDSSYVDGQQQQQQHSPRSRTTYLQSIMHSSPRKRILYIFCSAACCIVGTVC